MANATSASLKNLQIYNSKDNPKWLWSLIYGDNQLL